MKKYYGKEKCRILKTIRAEIARQNDIEWVVSECSHKGDCRGTCPKCEQEVRQLEAALARREALGKTIAVAGISAGLALSVAGCANPFATQGHMEAPSSGIYPATNEQATETETEPLQFESSMGEELPIPGGETEPPTIDTSELIDGEMPEMGAPVEREESEMTEPPIPGEEPEIETPLMGDPVIWDEETEEILMGDPLPPEWFTENEQ